MTKEEFILQSANLGYSNKKQGEKWCEKACIYAAWALVYVVRGGR